MPLSKECSARLKTGQGAVEPAYWRGIFGPSEQSRGAAEGQARALSHRGTLDDEGYVKFAPCLDADTVRRAADAIARVVAAGWPPVFALLSDAIWDALTGDGVCRAVRDVMGPDAVLRPGLWVKSVAPGASGWPPHVDVLAPDAVAENGRPRVLTGWLALSNVSVDSACMVVVTPRLADQARRFAEGGQVATPELLALLHHGRAVPVEAGGVLFWRRDVLHWGGDNDMGGGPRMSVAFEVGHAAGNDPSASGVGLPLGVRPSFADRGRLIAHNVCVYGADGGREPELAPAVPWAKSLLNP